MAKFNKENLYTYLDANNVCTGCRGYFANDLNTLITMVTEEIKPSLLEEVHSDKENGSFRYPGNYVYYNYFYLVHDVASDITINDLIQWWLDKNPVFIRKDPDYSADNALCRITKLDKDPEELHPIHIDNKVYSLDAFNSMYSVYFGKDYCLDTYSIPAAYTMYLDEKENNK